MALTQEQKRERAIERAKASQKRAFEKQREKQNSQEYREKMFLKQKAANQKAINKQREKQNDPERIKKIIESSKNKQNKAAKITTSKKVTKNKGLMGRPATAEEKRIMNAIGTLPCICCSRKGRYNPVISLHHLDGRNKPNAHAMVLPLCAPHHDTPIEDKAILEKYPDLVPFHAKGSLGGKAEWRKQNGNEWEMLADCYAELGIEIPFPLNDRRNDNSRNIAV